MRHEVVRLAAITECANRHEIIDVCGGYMFAWRKFRIFWVYGVLVRSVCLRLLAGDCWTRSCRGILLSVRCVGLVRRRIHVLLQVVLTTKRHDGALRVRSMRTPLLDWHGSCLVRLGDSNPFSAHFCIELHFNCSFSQVVAAEEDKHHTHTCQCLLGDYKAIKMQLCLRPNELNRQKTREINYFHRVKINRPQ